jgi:hypothetical protein
MAPPPPLMLFSRCSTRNCVGVRNSTSSPMLRAASAEMPQLIK